VLGAECDLLRSFAYQGDIYIDQPPPFLTSRSFTIAERQADADAQGLAGTPPEADLPFFERASARHRQP
jgi:hypothetical protein